jgi:hypothetical protein
LAISLGITEEVPDNFKVFLQQPRKVVSGNRAIRYGITIFGRVQKNFIQITCIVWLKYIRIWRIVIQKCTAGRLNEEGPV